MLICVWALAFYSLFSASNKCSIVFTQVSNSIGVFPIWSFLWVLWWRMMKERWQSYQQNECRPKNVSCVLALEMRILESAPHMKAFPDSSLSMLSIISFLSPHWDDGLGRLHITHSCQKAKESWIRSCSVVVSWLLFPLDCCSTNVHHERNIIMDAGTNSQVEDCCLSSAAVPCSEW